MTLRSPLLTTTRDTLAAHVRAGNEIDAYATFARLVYIAHATEGCEAQGVRLVDLPRLGAVVARAAADLAKLYEGVGHPMWLPSLADALRADDETMLNPTATNTLEAARALGDKAEVLANALATVTRERDEARELLRRVLDVERIDANRAGATGCRCMMRSRAAERAYEMGQCPHQLADTALAGAKS